MLLLPFYDRSPFRHWSKRKLAVSIMTVVVIGMVALTVITTVTTPPQEESEVATTLPEKILLGRGALRSPVCRVSWLRW